MPEYIDKDKLLKYLEDTIIFSGKTDTPYLNGQVNGAKLVISRIEDYKEDKRDGYDSRNYNNVDFGSRDIKMESSVREDYELSNERGSSNELINLWRYR